MFRRHRTEIYHEGRFWHFRCRCGAYASGGSKEEAEYKSARHIRQHTKVRGSS